MESIVVLCAHPDDEIFGVGGTIARFSKEKKKVHVLVFSYGEKSHPWMRETIQRSTREKESKAAGKLVGTTGIEFLGLREGIMNKELRKQIVRNKIKDFVGKHKPNRIFTHSSDDPHPDHKAIHGQVIGMLKEMKYAGEIYTFDIWNPGNVAKASIPRLVIDISETFDTKIKALELFKSQSLSLISLMPAVYSRALTAGREAGFTYGEVFYKVQ